MGDRPTRILFCESNKDGTVGGSYYSLLYLVKGLDRRRYDPTVVFYSDHTLMPAFKEASIETIVWPKSVAFTFARDLHGAFGWIRPLAMVVQRTLNLVRGYVMNTLTRARFLRARRVDIVHLNNSILYNHDWMAAARLVGAKCISHERGINDRYPPAAKYFGRRLDAVICISAAVYENMHQRGVGFENRVKIHNGLDPATMRISTPPEVLRVSYGIDPGAPVVVMLGNIKPWKGQETLIRALEKVRAACPAIRCVLVGDTSPGDREYDRSIRQLVSGLHLDEHVIFAGFQPNVADFLAMSDAVVHASVLPEPFGRVILEAMACHKAVIGARAGAIPELIAEGENGLTFPPGDSDRLAEAIIEVIRDPAKARRLGETGYQRLIREFHIQQNVTSTQRVYERLLTARRSA